MDYKLKPKKITKAAYYCLLLIDAILLVIYWVSAFHNDIVVITAEINSHISNFIISMIFYLGIGYTWILQKNAFKKVILLGGFVVIANIACETVMGFLNTVDIIDAVYGIAGTMISFCFLFVVNKYGVEIECDQK